MSFMLVAGGIVLGMFLLAYLRSGRFGMTVLALGAGYLLALLWVDTLAAHTMVQLSFLAWRDAVYMILVLLPGLLALFFSHKQKSLLPRIVAALAIAVLSMVLLLPLFSPESESQTVYAMIERYREVIMSGLLALGLLDMVFARLPKTPKHDKH